MLVSNMLHEGFSTETQGKEITPEKEQRPKVLMTLSDFKGDSQNRVIAILAWPIFYNSTFSSKLGMPKLCIP